MHAAPLLRLLLLLAPALLCFPGAAGAIVSDTHLIDGPGGGVAGVGDAAMSEDGSGGVVYLKTVDGRDRVFAAQFRDGVWRAPVRVDVGQGFDSSWPRIAAGDGGRLLVTWVQEFGVESDRMYSATLDPGAVSFQAPVPVDFNVGEATATYPDLAMNRGGQAYLAYRVVTDVSPANPPGYVGADVRVARYGSRLWSVLGTPVDRGIATPVRVPTAWNSPRVGIDIQGQGVVAWQEPDDEFVDRVWVRRLFGTATGIAIQASPSTWEGRPLRGAADAFALDVAGFGQAAVAFRQQPGQASALSSPRLMSNSMPEVFSERAKEFAGAHLADGGPRAALGLPSVAVEPRGGYLAGFGDGPATLLGRGDEFASVGVERTDEGASSLAAAPLVDLAGTGAGVLAWAEQRGAVGLVAVQERRADGVDEVTLASSPAGGQIVGMAMGGSGLGDAIVAWQQGTGASAQIAATVLDAPPDPFLVLLPSGWQRGKRVRVAWDRSPNAIGSVRYSVSVDDEPVREGLRSRHAILRPADLEGGRHRIQIYATDDAGQETGSRVGTLLVDRSPPRVELRQRGRRLVLSVADGPRSGASTLRPGSVRFRAAGPGRTQRKLVGGSKSPRLRVTHAFAAAGRFRVRVVATDRAGNRAVWKRAVRVR